MRTLWLALFVIVGLVAEASAQASDGIVIESYTGPRPEDANRLLSPVLDELAARGFVAGPDVVGRRFEQRVSRPSIVEMNSLDSFAEQVERGHKAWIAGRFDDAVKVLSPAVDAAHANPGAFAQNQPLREKLLKALIALALSQQRIGDQDATRKAFGEILRSFPDTQLSRATYGPEAFNLFEQVKKELIALGRGKLVVKVTNDGAAVFVNERFEGMGGISRGELLAGEYRVFVQLGKKASRVHRVRVTANGETTLTIDAEFDALVHSSPKWTGFQFADAATRERLESQYAAAFASAIETKGGVVVLGIDDVRGRPAVVASLVSMGNGREVRRASIPLDPDPSVEKLRALARFVAGDNAAPGIDIQLAGDANAARANEGGGLSLGDIDKGSRGGSRDGAGGGLWGGWKYVSGGAAVAAFAVGGYLLSIDGECSDDACAFQRNTAVPGWATLGGGVALAGVTVYLFIRGSGESSSSTAFVTPTSDGAYVGYTGRF